MVISIWKKEVCMTKYNIKGYIKSFWIDYSYYTLKLIKSEFE